MKFKHLVETVNHNVEFFVNYMFALPWYINKFIDEHVRHSVSDYFIILLYVMGLPFLLLYAFIYLQIVALALPVWFLLQTILCTLVVVQYFIPKIKTMTYSDTSCKITESMFSYRGYPLPSGDFYDNIYISAKFFYVDIEDDTISVELNSIDNNKQSNVYWDTFDLEIDDELNGNPICIPNKLLVLINDFLKNNINLLSKNEIKILNETLDIIKKENKK